MLNRIYKIIMKSEFLRKKSLSFSIHLNNYSYRLIKKFLKKPGEIHPKHKIMNYHKFFIDNIDKNDQVVDIGCGNGEVAMSVAPKVLKIVGIDIEQKNIEKAKTKNKFSNLTFIQDDATKYDFSQLKIRSFDKIILSNVLEHIENRVEFLTDLHNLSDTILLRVPMLNRDWLTVYKKENGYEYRLTPTHFTEYTEDSLNEELQRSGWQIESYSIQFGEFWGIIRSI